MINNTFLFIIIILTIIILFMCESNKEIIEGMTTFKWYDNNQVELGSRYNRCLDSMSARIKSNPNEVIPSNFLQGIEECADTFMLETTPLQDALVTRFSQIEQQRAIRQKYNDASIYCQTNDQRNGEGEECEGRSPGDLVKSISELQSTQMNQLNCTACASTCTSLSGTGCGDCTQECIWKNNLEAEEEYCPSCITEANGICADDCGGVTPCIPKSTSKAIYRLRVNQDIQLRSLANEYENLLCSGTTQCISRDSDNSNDSICAAHNNNQVLCEAESGCIYYNGMERDTLIQKRNAMLSLTDTKINNLQENLRKIGAKVNDDNDTTRSDQQDNTSPAWTGINPEEDNGEEIKTRTFQRLNSEVESINTANQAVIDANTEKDTESALRKNYAEKINNYRGLKALLSDDRKNNIEIRFGRCRDGETCGLATISNPTPDNPERRCSKEEVEGVSPPDFDNCAENSAPDSTNEYGNEDDYIKGQVNDQVGANTTELESWRSAHNLITSSSDIQDKMGELDECNTWKGNAQTRFNEIYPVYQELINQAPSCKYIFLNDENKMNKYCEKDSNDLATDNYKGGDAADAITCCPPPQHTTGDVPNILPTDLTTGCSDPTFQDETTCLAEGTRWTIRDTFGPNCSSSQVASACNEDQQRYIIEGRKEGIIKKKELIQEISNSSQNQQMEINQYRRLGNSIYGGADTRDKCEGADGVAGICSDTTKVTKEECCTGLSEEERPDCEQGNGPLSGNRNTWWTHRSGTFTGSECVLKEGETQPDPPCNDLEETACENSDQCDWNVFSPTCTYSSDVKNVDTRCPNIDPHESTTDTCETSAEKQLQYTENLMKAKNTYIRTCGESLLPVISASVPSGGGSR